MPYEVIIDSRVLDDFAKAFTYYNAISETLGSDFESVFLQAINKILHHPQHYYKVSKKFRRITVKKYPYMLVYEIKESSVIIKALFHH